MSRRFTVLALALAVAGGVYLSGGAAEASNMGFKLERNFPAIGPPANARTFRGIFFVAQPLFPGLGDIADSTMANNGRDGVCTGTGDMVVNADDALCDWWTSRAQAEAMNVPSTMIMTRFKQDVCQFEDRGVTWDALFQAVVTNGSFTDPFLNPGTQIDDDAYQIVVPFEGTPMDNQAVIVGSHDPSYTGFPLAIPPSNCRPNLPFINPPYHTMYRTVDEILCGLEGTDWVDVNENTTGAPPADGSPDTCPNGIFPDIGGGGSGAQITVKTFDNVPDATPFDNGFIERGAFFDTLFNVLVFNGTEFDLVPGDGYPVVLDHDGAPPEHTPTTFITPHF